MKILCVLCATSRTVRPVRVACAVCVAFCVTCVVVGSVVHYKRVNSKVCLSRKVQADSRRSNISVSE